MKIAVDIVLLPSKKVMDLSFDINNEIVKGGWNKIIFDEDTCIPHISILMWTIEEDNIQELVNKLNDITQDIGVLDLKIDKFTITKTSLWDNNYDLNVAKTEKIKVLHDKIFSRIWNQVGFDATVDMLYQNPVPEEITLSWINGHEFKFDYDKFRPHITLWVWGKAKPNIDLPVSFSSSKIAVYQLWNYCTCRKELARIDINN